MKGIIIKQTHCKDLENLAPGEGCKIRRLVVKEADNLVITDLRKFGKGLCVSADFHFDPKRDCEVIAVTEVPDDWVKKMVDRIRAEKEFRKIERELEVFFN